MQKNLTKEELATMLDGCEYRGGVADEIIEAAKENNLVIIHGASDDLVELRGAIRDEVGAGATLLLTRKGVPESDCEEGCPYYQRWLKTAVKRGEVREIRVHFGGETMDQAKYAVLGKPTWCFETTMPHAVFKMYETEGNEREYFCRGIVIDLGDVWPQRNYAQIVMEQGGHESC